VSEPTGPHHIAGLGHANLALAALQHVLHSANGDAMQLVERGEAPRRQARDDALHGLARPQWADHARRRGMEQRIAVRRAFGDRDGELAWAREAPRESLADRLARGLCAFVDVCADEDSLAFRTARGGEQAVGDEPAVIVAA